MLWRTPTKLLAILSVLLLTVSLQKKHVEGANILGLYTSHSPSHLIVHMSVVKALAEKGHNVTVVSSIKPKITHKNIHHIIIPPTDEQDADLNKKIDEMGKKKNNIFTMLSNMFGSLSSLISLQVELLQNKRFTDLYESDTKFDVVIMGYFMNDYQLGVAAKFKCPIIITWTGAQNELMDTYIGNPREMAYVPTMNMAVKVGERMNFLKRVKNVFGNMFFRTFKAIINYKMETFYKQLFTDNDKNFPSYQQMQKNVSLVFGNSHFSEGPIRPNVPAFIEIGGIQVKEKPDTLPKDIDDLLTGSKQNGAILFSLGSNLKGTSIKPETVKIIYNTLSSLKQNVIWKWEDEANTPGNATNIIYKKWLPQDDILAHPNLRLFITHAGKGGMAEAQYHAVPMVALPVFADQHSNGEKMASSGYGISLDMMEITADTFKQAVLEVLDNPVYSQNVKTFSQLYRDRPMTAKQNVVFWTEYVIRHHGAMHMQSPLVHLNALQTTSLDVIAFLLLVAYCIWRLLKLIFLIVFKKLYNKICASDGTEKKKSVKRNKKVKKN